MNMLPFTIFNRCRSVASGLKNIWMDDLIIFFKSEATDLQLNI